jgi:hypothetical protein
MPQASFAHILVMAKRLALSRFLLSFGGDAFGCEFDRAVNLIAGRPPTSGKRRSKRGPAHQLVTKRDQKRSSTSCLCLPETPYALHRLRSQACSGRLESGRPSSFRCSTRFDSWSGRARRCTSKSWRSDTSSRWSIDRAAHASV